jgi:hypothetical protein
MAVLAAAALWGTTGTTAARIVVAGALLALIALASHGTGPQAGPGGAMMCAGRGLAVLAELAVLATVAAYRSGPAGVRGTPQRRE